MHATVSRSDADAPIANSIPRSARRKIAASVRYVALCGEVMRRRGGDPFIDLKLKQTLMDASRMIDGLAVAHPSGIDGDVKLLNALTMEKYRSHCHATTRPRSEGSVGG
jgi:hypothetical protein